MNGEDQWKFIRTACKKLILHDLPENAEVGLVTFNEDANISHAIGNSNYLIVEKFKIVFCKIIIILNSMVPKSHYLSFIEH